MRALASHRDWIGRVRRLDLQGLACRGAVAMTHTSINIGYMSSLGEPDVGDFWSVLNLGTTVPQSQ